MKVSHYEDGRISIPLEDVNHDQIIRCFSDIWNEDTPELTFVLFKPLVEDITSELLKGRYLKSLLSMHDYNYNDAIVEAASKRIHERFVEDSNLTKTPWYDKFSADRTQTIISIYKHHTEGVCGQIKWIREAIEVLRHGSLETKYVHNGDYGNTIMYETVKMCDNAIDEYIKEEFENL